MRHDPCGRVHGDSTDVVASDLDLAGVQAGANGKTDLFRGGAVGQGAANRASWAVERRENTIASALHHRAAMLYDHLPRNLIVITKQPKPSLVAHRRRTAGRIYNI